MKAVTSVPDRAPVLTRVRRRTLYSRFVTVEQFAMTELPRHRFRLGDSTRVSGASAWLRHLDTVCNVAISLPLSSQRHEIKFTAAYLIPHRIEISSFRRSPTYLQECLQSFSATQPRSSTNLSDVCNQKLASYLELIQRNFDAAAMR